jgi:hypothetical protein
MEPTDRGETPRLSRAGRLLSLVRRRKRAVGGFLDGKSALIQAAARQRHVAGTNGGIRRHLDLHRRV